MQVYGAEGPTQDVGPADLTDRAAKAKKRASQARTIAEQAESEAYDAECEAKAAHAAEARKRLESSFAENASELLERLEQAYAAVLDQLEAQADGVEAINHSLQRYLHSGNESPLIGFKPDRAITPAEAFRDLAEILVRKERPHLDPRNTRGKVRYDDLLRWPDEPTQGSMTPSEYARTKIAFARTQSLREFHAKLVVRFAPEAVPEQAGAYVYQGLASAFSVNVPPKIIVPYGERESRSILFMRLVHVGGQMAWHLSADQLSVLEQALLATSTACTMHGAQTASAVVTTAGNELMTKLREDLRHYDHGWTQYGGEVFRVVLLRDKIEFHLSPVLMDMVRATINAFASGIEFVRL